MVTEYTKILKELRIKRGLSQAELARRLGVSRCHYGRIERGERTLFSPMLIQLADELNTSTDYIMGLTKEEKPYPPRDDKPHWGRLKP